MNTISAREIEVRYEPRDCWIGVYWTREEYGTIHWRTRQLRIYICIIPMLPIVLTFDDDV